MKASWHLIGVVLLLGLAACSGEPAGSTAAALPKLDSISVTAGGDGSGRSWDGVVEASTMPW